MKREMAHVSRTKAGQEQLGKKSRFPHLKTGLRGQISAAHAHLLFFKEDGGCLSNPVSHSKLVGSLGQWTQQKRY